MNAEKAVRLGAPAIDLNFGCPAKTVNRHRGGACLLEPDGNGRVLLPASQRNASGIDKKAVLVGAGSKFELWSEQAHLAQIRQTIGDEASEAMHSLTL